KEEEESAENPVGRCIGQSRVQSDRHGDEDVGCVMKTKSGMTTQVRGLPCLSNSGHGKPRLSYNGHMPKPLSLQISIFLPHTRKGTTRVPNMIPILDPELLMGTKPRSSWPVRQSSEPESHRISGCRIWNRHQKDSGNIGRTM